MNLKEKKCEKEKRTKIKLDLLIDVMAFISWQTIHPWAKVETSNSFAPFQEIPAIGTKENAVTEIQQTSYVTWKWNDVEIP